MTQLPSNNEIDKRTICSSEDIPILEFYKDHFESVFICLNPFLKIKNTSKYTIDNFWNEEREPEEKKKTIDNTKPIKWSEIIAITNLKNINQVDIALRTGINGLLPELEYKKYLADLESVIIPKNILTPGEGYIPDIQQNEILNAIAKLGYNTIWVLSETREYGHLKKISDLIESGESIYEQNIYTEDKKILITVHWDSFQTYICSTKQNVEQIVKEAKLEGFYCDKKTQIYWSLK